MRCPVCKEPELATHELEADLRSRDCPRCHGRWVPSYEYSRWREAHPEDLPERAPEEAPDTPEVTESGKGKLCPECGRILLPYKVGHGLSFSLDRCGSCGGFWMDANEWEALKARNLHDNVHSVFGQAWQRRVFEEEQARRREERLRERFGEADYAEAWRIREWAWSHPRCEELLAFLTNPD